MDLSDADILHVARLARLHLTPDELGPVRADLNRVLAYVSQLQKLDLEGVRPTMHVVETHAPLREDRPEPSLGIAEATKNGPVVENGMFLVPRIMEGGASGE
ncbi:MAG: Asp-tRNA(Asn)/Glu-tRNA(Gln) amidotransferase subunit GatC [Firmicutes bacterium]|nr:Asp-tRNA(Asn)/Glu-tRNA(Gln) amidotransferase subunit GatC [Bacillota bacterium]